MERHQLADAFGYRLWRTPQAHLARVEWQTVETRTELGGECFQPGQRRFLLEHHGVAFQRHRRIEDASTATGAFLGIAGVRRGVEIGRASCRERVCQYV